MSYDVYLTDESGGYVSVPEFEDGGTYAVGGTDIATLNITYNYCEYLAPLGDGMGLEWLDGKVAQDTINPLQDLVNRLGTVQDCDYWAATPGNVGHALSVLLSWARQHPDAVWIVV